MRFSIFKAFCEYAVSCIQVKTRDKHNLTAY